MNYPKVNRHFTHACLALPPILGSVTSVIWHGGAVWSLFAVATRQRPLSSDHVMRFLTFFLYLYVLTTIITSLANGLDLSDADELVQLLTLLLFPFSYSLFAIAWKKDVANAAALAAMVAGYGAAALAFVQYFLTDARPEGGAGNALVFATVACLAGTASLAGAFTLQSRWRLALLGAYIAAFAAIILSGSRSIWLAIAIATFVILISCRAEVAKLIRQHAKLTFFTVTVIGVLSSGILLSRVEHLAHDWNALVEHKNYDTSLGARVVLWERAAVLIGERPLLGHGMQNTKQLVFDALNSAGEFVFKYTHFHNSFLTIAVESGLIGLAAIIGVFVVAMVAALRALRSDQVERRFGALLLSSLVITYAVGGSFNLVIGHDLLDTSLMIFLITGSWLASGSEQAPARNGLSPNQV